MAFIKNKILGRTVLPDRITRVGKMRASGTAGAEGQKMPLIQLSGKWLREIGFTTGKTIVIAPEEGKIVVMLREKYTKDPEKHLIESAPRSVVKHIITPQPKRRHRKVIGKVDVSAVKKRLRH